MARKILEFLEFLEILEFLELVEFLEILEFLEMLEILEILEFLEILEILEILEALGFWRLGQENLEILGMVLLGHRRKLAKGSFFFGGVYHIYIYICICECAFVCLFIIFQIST